MKEDKKVTMAKRMTKASHIFPKEFRRYSSFDEAKRLVKKEQKKNA